MVYGYYDSLCDGEQYAYQGLNLNYFQVGLVSEVYKGFHIYLPKYFGLMLAYLKPSTDKTLQCDWEAERSFYI